MKKIIQLAFLAVLSTPLSMFAQNEHAHTCGTSAETQEVMKQEMMSLRQRFGGNVQFRGAVAYVPVCFHMVANTAGVGRASEGDVLDMLCEWNKLYESNNVELQFYLKEFNYINNTDVYEAPGGGGVAEIRMLNNRRTNAMNVFVTNTANTSGAGTTLAFYLNTSSTGVAYSADWIVIKKSEATAAGGGTMAHEAGHFFSLPHTFFGWECAPFVATTAAPCAPNSVVCNNRNQVVERSDRTGADANCSTAADGFCDTPADYNFGFGWNNCNWTGIAKDPLCVAVNPDETNLMGYFLSCGRIFSTEQKAAMRNNYLNLSGRQYLRNGNIIPNLVAPDAATNFSPANNGTSPFFNSIRLNWDDVPNALGYIVTIDRALSFSVDPRTFVVTSSELSVMATNTPANFLRANTAYYWKVRPYGAYKTCTATSPAINKFTTSAATTDVTEIGGLSAFTIAPNPATNDLNITLTSERGQAANFKIINIAGQVMQTEQRELINGLSNYTLDISRLNNGIYIVAIETTEGTLTRRFSVAK